MDAYATKPAETIPAINVAKPKEEGGGGGGVEIEGFFSDKVGREGGGVELEVPPLNFFSDKARGSPLITYQKYKISDVT